MFLFNIMTKGLKHLFVAGFSGLLLCSCLKKESFPPEPIIAFKSFNAYDSYNGQLVFSFTDGDGDIGLKSDENLTLSGPDSIYYYNLYIKVLYKNSQGNFVDTTIYYTETISTDTGLVTVTKVDTGAIRQRIQFVENNNKDKALKGEIYVQLVNGYRQSTAHKTIKYRFYMYDRARNRSNIAESEELNVP
jgi:hypothetical protein